MQARDPGLHSQDHRKMKWRKKSRGGRGREEEEEEQKEEEEERRRKKFPQLPKP